MPNTQELLMKKRELLLEKKRLLEQGVDEAMPKRKSFIPEEVSAMGKGIESVVAEQYRPALKMAAETIKSQAFQPVIGFGSKLTLEDPELVARTSYTIMAPASMVLGQVSKFLVNQGLQSEKGAELLDSALMKAQENVKKQIKSQTPSVFNPLFDRGVDASRNWIANLTNEEAHSTIVNLSEMVGAGASAKILAGTKWGGTLFDVPIPGKGFLQTRQATKLALQNPANFSREVRGVVLQNKHEKTKAITNAIDGFTKQNPDVGVDISEPMDNLRQVLADPDSAADLRRILGAITRKSKNQTLKNLLDNPELAKAVNMRQLQDLKNSIEFFPSIQSKINKGAWDKVTLGEQDLLNLVDDIKLVQTDAIPQLKGARQAFSAFMEDYKAVRPLLSEKVLEKQLRANFSGQTGEVVERIAKTIPEPLRNKISAFSNASTRIENSKKLLGSVLKFLGYSIGGSAIGYGMYQTSKWAGGGD